MVKRLFFGWICWEIVWKEFDENLGIHALLPSWQSQLVIFTKSLFIIGQYSQLCHLLPNFHDFLSSVHMTLTVSSICRFWVANWANFMWCKLYVDWTMGKRVLMLTVYVQYMVYMQWRATFSWGNRFIHLYHLYSTVKNLLTFQFMSVSQFSILWLSPLTCLGER